MWLKGCILSNGACEKIIWSQQDNVKPLFIYLYVYNVFGSMCYIKVVSMKMLTSYEISHI